LNTLARKWVDALRSGKYRQTQGHLRDYKGFCCLGVLCDVFDPTRWTHDNFYYHIYDDDYKATAMVPDYIRQYLGATLIDFAELADLNDFGASFDYIADVIEQKYKDSLILKGGNR